mgnify:CR=1 FL=1
MKVTPHKHVLLLMIGKSSQGYKMDRSFASRICKRLDFVDIIPMHLMKLNIHNILDCNSKNATQIISNNQGKREHLYPTKVHSNQLELLYACLLMAMPKKRRFVYNYRYQNMDMYKRTIT